MVEFRVGLVRDGSGLTFGGGTFWFLHCGRPALLEPVGAGLLRLSCAACGRSRHLTEYGASLEWARGLDSFWWEQGDPDPVRFLIRLGMYPDPRLFPSWRRRQP